MPVILVRYWREYGEKMSKKLQITIPDEVYTILEREAEKNKMGHILTYASGIFSKCIAKMEREGKFDDGFG